MAETVSDFLVRRLIEWDIKRIYGYPGDGINGIMGALWRAGVGEDPQAKIEYVQVRHEEMAAFMACAHSKFTGEVGVCLATSGPGAIHLLNGLYYYSCRYAVMMVWSSLMRADQFEKKERQLRAALEETTVRLSKHFANPAARQSAAAYLRSLLSSVERKNSWQLAEVAGFDTPYRFQHLLGRGAWDADALRDEQLGEVLAGLGQEDAVLAIDETGFIKQGKKSVGVKRQYCGASGKLDNCQIGVFLSWQTSKGHALIDRALYLPEEWAEDRERRRAVGVPEDVEFAPKPTLARRLVERVLAAGARPAWVVADAVYGSDSKLRFALEAAKQPYVLAVTGQQCVWMGFGERRVKAVKAQAPADAWTEISVGAGTKGPRVFDWAALRINHPYGKAWQRFLLLRRSRSKAEEITAYLVFGASDTPLEEMARIAGRRWAIEESFAQSKSEVGLDQYEVRSWTGWHRHMTLAMTAQALLAITRARLFAKPAASESALAAFKKSRGLPVASVG